MVNSRQGINKPFYHKITEQVLFSFYPKHCGSCGELMTKAVKNRPYSVRCGKCHTQKSRLSGTPLHHLKLPMWMFGWVVQESYKRYPNVLTSSEIHRRLGISYKAALNLKRRFQLFCSHGQDAAKELFKQQLIKQRYELPVSRKVDLTQYLKDKPAPVNVDTIVLFSASQRANKGRKRHRHGGQTSSIYLNDSLGGRQIGSLFNTIAIKQGPVFLTSVSDQRRLTLSPILHSHIPYRYPIFSDEGYKFLSRPNHRMINHNAKSKDKRYRWAKDRWSKNGVHNQTAEGVQSSFKSAMKSYRYFSPTNSQLYANEWAFMKNTIYFGFYPISRTVSDANSRGDKSEAISTVNQRLGLRLEQYRFKPLKLYQRKTLKNAIFDQIASNELLKTYCHAKKYKELRAFIDDYQTLALRPAWQQSNERKYLEIAEVLWGSLQRGQYTSLSKLSIEYNLPRQRVFKIARRLYRLHAIELIDRTPRVGARMEYLIKPRLPHMPYIFYSISKENNYDD